MAGVVLASDDAELDRPEVRRVLEAILTQGPSSLGMTQDDFEQMGVMGPQALDAATVTRVLDYLGKAGLAEVDRIGPEFLVRPTRQARRLGTLPPPASAAPPRAVLPSPSPPLAPVEAPAATAPVVPAPKPVAPPEPVPPSGPSRAPEPVSEPAPPVVTPPPDTSVDLERRRLALLESEAALKTREEELVHLMERARTTTANLAARQRELDEREEELDELAERLMEQARALSSSMAQVQETHEGLAKVLKRPRARPAADPASPPSGSA